MQRNLVCNKDADRIAVPVWMRLARSALYFGATVKLPLLSGPVP